jgi:hypothetical protein
MEKYQKGKVYAIICNKTGRRYVGSTCEPTLARRLAQHVQGFKCWLKNDKGFLTSFDIIKDENYYIILLELYPCNSRDELRMCEQKHIDLNECINKQKAYQSKEKLQEYRKKYIEQHRDEIREKQKQYNEQNRDEIREYQKEYYKQHRDELREKQKQYDEQNRNKKQEYGDKNRQKLNDKAREKVCCPKCQKEMNYSNLSRHQKICKSSSNTSSIILS